MDPVYGDMYGSDNEPQYVRDQRLKRKELIKETSLNDKELE